MKRFIFHTIMWMPLLLIAATACHFLFWTNLPQLWYITSVRNLMFDCIDFVPDDFVYKMKPGRYELKNIEYDTVLTHDADGFRNRGNISRYDVVVLGDSFAHGLGVGDDQTFASVLSSRYHFPTKNLAISSYATMRELDVLSKYGRDAKYIVLQYCSNDKTENEASLRLSKDAFKLEVLQWWRKFIANYDQGKAMGYRKPIQNLAMRLRTGAYDSKASWQRDLRGRATEQEASYFAQVLARYRDLFEGKRLIIFEVSEWQSNSPKFEATFRAELKKLDWLNYSVLDTTKILNEADYLFLDDHINSQGHGKLAAAIANEIAQWERTSPIIENH